MPVWFYLPIPQLEVPQPVTVRVSEWLLDEGTAVHQGTKVVVIEIAAGRFAVSANGDGLLRKRLFPVGAEIESSLPISVIAADGESIPYGKPYSLAERLT